MKFIDVQDKAAYLEANYPFTDIPALTDKRECLHCGKEITVGDFKVEVAFNELAQKDIEYIICPNAPECDGTVIDWMPIGFTKFD